MKTKIILLFLVLFTCTIFFSCSDDSSDDLSNDPQGTILINLNSGDGDLLTISDYFTNGGYFSIDIEYNNTGNFATYNINTYLVDVGSVKNISSITTVPDTGWRTTLACEKGHGYIVRVSYLGENYYIRIYVVDSSNERAKVKVQYRFEPN